MNKLYVVVRRDLSGIYAAVQGGHAVAQWMYQYSTSDDGWNNGYLIYVTVKEEMDLWKLFDRVDHDGYDVSKWQEPDRCNQLTAIAVLVDDSTDQIFKHLSLL